MATVFLGYRQTAYDRLSASWKDNCWSVLCRTNIKLLDVMKQKHCLDLGPSNYFLIRNLKYRLCGTWFIDDESLKIAVKAWSESQSRKFYFQGINS